MNSDYPRCQVIPLLKGSPSAPVEPWAEPTTAEVLAAIDDPNGALAGKSPEVRAAIRQAWLDAETYEGDAVADMGRLLEDLHAEAVRLGVTVDDAADA